jgi:hypothetical protein
MYVAMHVCCYVAICCYVLLLILLIIFIEHRTNGEYLSNICDVDSDDDGDDDDDDDGGCDEW